jgi:hypothetical protein
MAVLEGPVVRSSVVGDRPDPQGVPVPSAAPLVRLARRVNADEVRARFGRLALELSSDGEEPLSPRRLVRLVSRVLEAADHCGLTVHRDGHLPETVAATDQVASRLERLQSEVGEGPSLDAAAGLAAIAPTVPDVPRVLAVDDLAEAASLWPAFAARCLDETPVRSLLSIPLDLEGSDRAAVTCYASRPHAFLHADVAAGSLLVPFATAAVQSALDHMVARQLRVELESSRHVGTAIGIVMARRLVTSEGALELLEQAAARRGDELHHVALSVAETGDLPRDDGDPPDELEPPPA